MSFNVSVTTKAKLDPTAPFISTLSISGLPSPTQNSNEVFPLGLDSTPPLTISLNTVTGLDNKKSPIKVSIFSPTASPVSIPSKLTFCIIQVSGLELSNTNGGIAGNSEILPSGVVITQAKLIPNVSVKMTSIVSVAIAPAKQVLTMVVLSVVIRLPPAIVA